MGHMKELKEEYRRLKKMYAESQMSADILREAIHRVVRQLALPVRRSFSCASRSLAACPANLGSSFAPAFAGVV